MMDYQEAIEVLLNEIGCVDLDTNNRGYIYESEQKFMDACNTAVSAMKELQQLHDQGFSLDRMKDIDFRKEIVEHINYDAFMSLKDELEEYKQIGTLEEVREAMEKQNSKTPTYEGDGYAPDGSFVWDEWICPRCGISYEVDYDEYDYCPNCGQSIDWSEENVR